MNIYNNLCSLAENRFSFRSANPLNHKGTSSRAKTQNTSENTGNSSAAACRTLPVRRHKSYSDKNILVKTVSLIAV